MLVQHLNGVEQILELYPALAAGGLSVLDKPGEAKLGLVLQASPTAIPQDCGDPTKGGQGYSGTTRRNVEDTKPIAPNVSARCTAPASSGTDIRWLGARARPVTRSAPPGVGAGLPAHLDQGHREQQPPRAATPPWATPSPATPTARR